MTESGDRMAAVETRLDTIGQDLSTLKGDVQVLKDDVQVLKDDVRGLRVLYEHHDTQIQRIAEVQVQHGQKLEEHGTLLRAIRKEVAPLGDLRDFVRQVVENHENRISALEKHAGPRRSG